MGLCRLRQNVAAADEASQVLASTCKAKDEEIAELQARLADVTETIHITRAQVAEKESAVEEARAEKRSVEAQLATCLAELSRTESALNETRQSLEDCLQKLEVAEETLEAAREEVSEITTVNETLTGEKTDIEKRLAQDAALWEARERELVESLRGAEKKARESGRRERELTSAS